jgi:WD40 repeat protein
VGQAAFSGDGRRLTAATSCDEIAIWDTASGRLLRMIRNARTNYSTPTLSNDGRFVAIGSPDTTASIWSADTGGRIALLHGHTATVVSAAFDPSGRRLATASLDRTVRIWDIASGRTLRVLRGPDLAPAFSSDGRDIVTSNHAGTLEVWPACPACGNAKALLDLAGRRVTRGFTSQERNAFLSGL